MSIVYKTLFEVKLLHEYYLTRSDGSVIFASADQASRLSYLAEEFARDMPVINDDLQFAFVPAWKTYFEGLSLKVLPAYSGFRVVMRVNPVVAADQSVTYEPFAPMPANLQVFIQAIRLREGIDNFTNSRTQSPLRAGYVFSNTDLLGARSFPFLSSPLAMEDPTVMYEQGQLSLSAANKVQEFFRRGNADDWSEIPGASFANEQDRILLPENFVYHFPDAANLTTAQFSLKDSSGNVRASLTVNQPSGMRSSVPLDFSGKFDALEPNDPVTLSDRVFSLEVNTDNGYRASHPLLCSNPLVNGSPFAIFHLQSTTGNPLFSLFDAEGHLVTRRDALGQVTPAPVFELAFTSRFAYWRFVNNKDKELLVSPELTDYVDKQGKLLVTKTPRSLARHWFQLRREVPPGTVYVPNPGWEGIQLAPDRRLFLDVPVSSSELFPVAP